MATFTVTLSASARDKLQNAKRNALFKLVHECLAAASIVLLKKGVVVVLGSAGEVVVRLDKKAAKSVNLDAMQLQLGDLGVVSLSSVQASSSSTVLANVEHRVDEYGGAKKKAKRIRLARRCVEELADAIHRDAQTAGVSFDRLEVI